MIDAAQNYLALDLELNQPSGKIIQIGIAIGNATQKRENYITKKWYIHPNEQIDPFITDLTGITDADISRESYSHDYVARELSAIITKYNVFINPVTWGGADSTDLQSEFSKNQVEFRHFGRRWIDVKTWYTLLMLGRDKNPTGGLSSAMGAFKLQFKGTAHRADIDAENTLAFFFKLLERQRGLEKLLIDAKSIDTHKK